MSKSTVWSILVTVIASASLNADDTSKDASNPLASGCPILKETELKTLADKGEIDLNGQSFRLVFEQEISNNYNKYLIESQSNLADFLKKSTPTLTVTRYINSHRNSMMKYQLKNHCPYTLSRGMEIVVVAIMPMKPVS